MTHSPDAVDSDQSGQVKTQGYLVTGSSKTITRELSASCLTVSDTGTVLPSLVRNLTTFPLREADYKLAQSFHHLTYKRPSPLCLDQAQADQAHGWTLALQILFEPQVTRAPGSKDHQVVFLFSSTVSLNSSSLWPNSEERTELQTNTCNQI